MLSAVAFILMFLDFSIPSLIPDFIRMDVSELPALIAAFSLGPVYGVAVCLIKNLLHLLITTTGGVGELSNFLLGAVFVLVAGSIYKRNKSQKSALIGSLLGAAAMAVFSVISNYYLIYPAYSRVIPEWMILIAYRLINLSIENLLQCSICFNMPFTFVKGLISVVLTFLVYKPLSPIWKGAAR